jgi:hypothetical protein
MNYSRSIDALLWLTLGMFFMLFVESLLDGEVYLMVMDTAVLSITMYAIGRRWREDG